MKHKVLILLSTCLALSLSSTLSIAKTERKRKGPPPEAFELCEGKALGDEVTITTREGDTLAASCQALPDDENVLVAVPNDHKRPAR